MTATTPEDNRLATGRPAPLDPCAVLSRLRDEGPIRRRLPPIGHEDRADCSRVRGVLAVDHHDGSEDQ